MKKLITASILLTVVLSLAGTEGKQGADDILIAPDFVPAFYDHFSRNFLNTVAFGMGNNVVAMQGGIENSLINPASFKAADLDIHLELQNKSDVREYNRFIKEEHRGEETVKKELPDYRQHLEQAGAGVLAGFGYPLNENISIGASYNIPQSIRYNLFTRLLKTGNYIDRFPTMINHQGRFTLSGHTDNFSAGLNLIVDHYKFSDLRMEYTFDRIVIMNETVFRLQPGVLYGNERYSLGMSYLLPTDHTFTLANQISAAPTYHVYDNVTLPGALEAGLMFNYDPKTRIAFSACYEQTGGQFDKFDDRLILKAGVARKLEEFIVRGGIISVPSVYSGRHDIIKAVGRPGEEDTPFEFEVEYDYLTIDKADQLILTGGFTYPLEVVDISAAFGFDLLGNVDLFQASMSLGIRLGEILKSAME